MAIELDQYLAGCKRCAENFVEDTPCLEAHKAVASGGTAVYAVDARWMPHGCPFACPWTDLLELASARATVRTNELGKVVLKQFAKALGKEPDWSRHKEVGVEAAGYVMDYTTSPARRVFCHNTESFWEGSSQRRRPRPGAEKWVLVKAVYREQVWKEFMPWFLANVGGSITAMPYQQRLAWVLTVAMKEMPGAFAGMTKEILADPRKLAAMGLVVAAFAVANALPPTRVFAMIFGVAMDGADIVEAGRLFLEFSRQMQNAYTSNDLNKAGKTCGQWLVHLALALGLPIAGTVAGAAGRAAADKLQEWLVRRKVEEWRAVMGERPNPYGGKPSGRARVQLPDPKRTFKSQLRDINLLRKYYIGYIERLHTLAEHTKSPAKQQACQRLIKEYGKRHKLLTEWAPETIGHIQCVVAGGKLMRGKVAEWKKVIAGGGADRVKQLLQDDFGMEPGEAEQVLKMISRVEESALDFTRHDQDLGGPANRGKMSAYIASRLSLDAKSLERLVQDSQSVDARFKGRDVNSYSEQELLELARQLELSSEQIRAGLEVDQGRVGHNTAFAHHQPSQPADWFEYGIDTVHAMMQRRSYRPQGAALDDVNPYKTHHPGEQNLCVGMLKLAKGVLKGLDESWLRDPQSMLMNILD